MLRCLTRVERISTKLDQVGQEAIMMIHLQFADSLLVLVTVNELVDLLMVLCQPRLVLGIVGVVDGLIRSWGNNVEFGVEHIYALQQTQTLWDSRV